MLVFALNWHTWILHSHDLSSMMFIMEGWLVPPLTANVWRYRQIEVVKIYSGGIESHLTWITYVKLPRPNINQKFISKLCTLKKRKNIKNVMTRYDLFMTFRSYFAL